MHIEAMHSSKMVSETTNSDTNAFLSVSTDMTDGIKKWKRRALSTQKDLALKKMEIGPVLFAVLPVPENV